MKKLLQINSVVNSGSTGRIAEEIGQVAMVNGWDSYIAYGRDVRPSNSVLIKIGKKYDIKNHGLQTRLFDRHGLGSNSATVNLVDQIDKIKPDIIHLHNLHGYYINIEVLFKYLVAKNTPIVWTFHDCWPMTGHCTHFEFIECNKWKTQCFNCPQKSEYPASYLIDRSKENFKLKKELFTCIKNLTIVPVSQWLSGLIKQSFLSASEIKIIYNGINTNLFSPKEPTKIREKFNLRDHFIVLGVASVWNTRKGLSDFIELSRKINNKTTIILVGLNNRQIKSLPQNIIGISRTESVKELAEFYSVADLFVNPTWEDNFPTTNLEAMSCGTPVVTYQTGGSAESIKENTGFIVEKGDIEGILKAIDKIKSIGKRKFSKDCRENILRNFNNDQRYLDYLKLYTELLKKNKNRMSK